MNEQPRQKYSRRDRKEGILIVLQLLVHRDGLTSHQLAFWLSMTPSSHLRGMVKELVSEGLVYERWDSHRPNIKKRIYQLTLPGTSKATAILAKRHADAMPF